MTADYPWANSTTRTGSCVLCDLTTPHPDRDPGAIMYHVTFSRDPKDHALICKAHAIECDLITDRLVAAKTRAEVAVIQHLRGEEHRHDVCPLPHEEEVRGCSCGMADYGAPGHDGHEEEVSHRETVPPFPDSLEIRTRAAATAMSPDEVIVVEHVRNRHVPGRYPVTCAMCTLQDRLDSIIEG